MGFDRRAMATGEPSGGSNRRRAMLGVGVAVALVAAALTAVFGVAGWYAERVALPRYCDDPKAALVLVRRVLTEVRPAGGDSARPYLVAAKLLYLVPQAEDETVDAYLIRLRGRIDANCSRTFGQAVGLGSEATGGGRSTRGRFAGDGRLS